MLFSALVWLPKKVLGNALAPVTQLLADLAEADERIRKEYLEEG